MERIEESNAILGRWYITLNSVSGIIREYGVAWSPGWHCRRCCFASCSTKPTGTKKLSRRQSECLDGEASTLRLLMRIRRYKTGHPDCIVHGTLMFIKYSSSQTVVNCSVMLENLFWVHLHLNGSLLCQSDYKKLIWVRFVNITNQIWSNVFIQ